MSDPETVQYIEAQQGPQLTYLESSADIIIFGGGAGGGKTFIMLIDAARYVDIPGYSAVIFRRTYPQIKAPGGLWQTSETIYGAVGLEPRYSKIDWRNPDNASTIEFHHLQHIKNVYDWQGAQLPFIGLDELTHFEEEMFWYLLSRNRSICGVKPCMRGTCNPDPDSWVRRLIDWWIGEDGYPVQERAGVIRWMARYKGEVVWYDTEEAARAAGHDPKSFTFIPSLVTDNKVLLEGDPSYIASLKALPTHDCERLLKGNWNVRAAAGSYFPRHRVEIVEDPGVCDDEIVYWDRAATEANEVSPDPDWTSGTRMGRKNGVYYVKRVYRDRCHPLGVQQMIRNAASEAPDVTIGLEGDPGQAGKAELVYLVQALAGYPIKTARVTKSKELRAAAFSSQWHSGNVKIVRGPWNEAFLSELEGFPVAEKDDQVDSSSGAFNHLAMGAIPGVRSL